MREIVNALFYQNRTGCQWQLLPHDLPPWSAVCYYFRLWRDDGTDQVIHDLLRCQVRQKAGRAEDPSAIALDTQSVRAANHVPAATTGKDAAKRVPGRKRGLAVDALGLIIAVVVMAASATDNQIGVMLIDRVVAHTPTVTKAWVDALSVTPRRQVPRTRTGAAWFAICAVTLGFVVLIVFMLQNTRSTDVSFLWMRGTVPVALALFIAAVGAALLTMAVGVARIAQLRHLDRRRHR